MSKLLKPKRSQNFLVPKNLNQWDMKSETGQLGKYEPKSDQAFTSSADVGAVKDIAGVDLGQNIDHHEHQHRILRHIGDKLNIHADGEAIDDPKVKSHVLAQHLMDNAKLSDDEMHAVESTATGGNIKFDSGDLKGKFDPNEAISNIVGWMNMGNKHRTNYLAHLLGVDKDHESIGSIHDKVDPHVRNAYKKLTEALHQLQPGHTIHWKEDNTTHHQKT